MKPRIASGLALCLAVSLVLCSFGQQPEGKAKGKLPRYWTKLGLSDQRRKAVAAIQASFKAKIDALKQQISDLEKEQATQLRKILTPLQREGLQKLVAASALADPPAKESPKDAKK